MKYKTITSTKKGFIKNKPAVTIAARNTRKINPCFTLISPEAMGRYFFFGWERSDSASIISLIIYIQLDANEKMKNASMDAIKYGRSNTWREKIRGAKTKKFLIHCLGRISFIK